MRIILGIVFVFSSIHAIAQLPALIPCRKGDLWGYCDSNKVVKIEPKFLSAGWFNEVGQAEVYYLGYRENEYFESDSDVYGGWINTDGNLTPYKYENFDTEYYYYETHDSIVFVSKKSGKKTIYVGVGYRERFYNPGCFVFLENKTLHIYISNKGHYSFTDADFLTLEKALDDDVLIYSLNPHDSSVKIISRFERAPYFICLNKSGQRYIRYLKGKTQYLDTVPLQFIKAVGETFMLHEKNDWSVYNKKGKKKFSVFSENYLEHFGSNLFCEAIKQGSIYHFNIISNTGKYLAKNLKPYQLSISYPYGVTKVEKTYFRDDKGCYHIQEIDGKESKFCRNDTIIHFDDNFTVFKVNDTTIDVYGKEGRLIFENLTVDKRIACWPYYENNDYFTFTQNQKLKLLSAKGEVINVPYNLDRFIPINANFFFGSFIDSQGYTIVIFDKRGHVRHQYIHYRIGEEGGFYLNTIENKFPVTGCILPLGDYRPSGEAAFSMLYVGTDTTYEINFNKSDINGIGPAYISTEDFYLTDFSYVFPVQNNKTKYAFSSYYYIDKYGTVYYDE